MITAVQSRSRHMGICRYLTDQNVKKLINYVESDFVLNKNKPSKILIANDGHGEG